MKILRILGFVWVLPATVLVWTFYILPAWGLGWLTYGGSPTFLVAMFVVAKQRRETWYTRAWRDWAGWSGPCVVLLKEDPALNDAYRRTVAHELRHCAQQFALGLFFYPAYLFASLFVWLFLPGSHAYLDNPFERDARRAAGQQVDIPRAQWRQGPEDRWPWW
jgi:hypothetical protein